MIQNDQKSSTLDLQGNDNFGKVMIKVVGSGGIDTSQTDTALHLWQENLRQGNITFYQGREVIIKIAGYYLIQVRVSIVTIYSDDVLVGEDGNS